MSPSTFFVADLDAVTDTVRVTGPEARHAIQVQRIGVGEQIDLVNGNGRRVGARVANIVGSDEMTCTVHAVIDEPAPQPRVTVVQALIKDAELAVDLLTQAGVDRIVPWAAQRSVVHWRGARADKAHTKWVNAAHQAAKQSRRAWWPQIAPLAQTSEVERLLESADVALVCDGTGLDVAELPALPAAGDVLIVVGPEGGIAPDELHAGQPIRLGPGVWRSVSAGMAALVALFARSGRWTVGG